MLHPSGPTFRIPRRRRQRAIAVLVAALLLGAASAAQAQYVVRPPRGLGLFRSDLIVIDPGSLDVAVANDGRAVVVWSDYKIKNHYADDPILGIGPFSTTSLTATFRTTWLPIRLASSSRPRVTALADGGLLVTWVDWGGPSGPVLSAQRLGGTGIPDGDVRANVSELGGFNGVGYHSSAALPSGGVVAAWRDFQAVRFRKLDPSGAPSGPAVIIESVPFDTAARIEVEATYDGGFVVAWQPDAESAPKAQHFTAAGEGIGGSFAIAGEPALLALAASPVADVLAALFWRGATEPVGASELWLRRFTSAGVPLGSEERVNGSGEQGVAGDVEFDVAGNLYVVWTGSTGVRARGYRADGTPLGSPVTITGTSSASVRAARTAEGDFVNVTSPPGAAASVVSLCTPGTSMCGDGVLDPLCERCDDGAANSDSLPDACRTTCRPARCGDGTIDTGETCDDGNHESCDGCSLTCQTEVGLGCGDGVPFPSCGEACDDGNAVVGDGCSPTCSPERARGGGAPASDCYAEWTIDNPTNVPLFDADGRVANVQRCVDDDPACDRDGGIPGSCTFAVRVCANNTDIPACEAGLRLRSWDLMTPTAKQAAKDPVAAAIRASFEGTVDGAVVGTTLRDVCSPEVLVPVPLRRGVTEGKRKLKSRATLYSGARDSDTLQLICLP